MSDEFINAIAELETKQEIRGFIKELLTPTERIMLAKRLAAIMMLKKGYSFRVIEKTLKISSSTSLRFWKMTKIAPLATITKNVKTKEVKKKFWDEIEKLLRLGMPPYGRGRWARTLKLLDRE